MRGSDIQNGRVLANWKVTALVVFASPIAVGVPIGADLLPAALVGAVCAAVWLALELRSMESVTEGET